MLEQLQKLLNVNTSSTAVKMEVTSKRLLAVLKPIKNYHCKKGEEF